jgi:hypothetical protein
MPLTIVRTRQFFIPLSRDSDLRRPGPIRYTDRDWQKIKRRSASIPMEGLHNATDAQWQRAAPG